VAALLVAIGMGTFVAAGTRSTAARAVGGNLPIDRGSTDPRDLSANNSPVLVANPIRPANLAVVGRVDLPQYSCTLHVSFDSGGSWQHSELPLPEPKVVRCFSPDASFGPDGTLYVSFSSIDAVAGQGSVFDAVWVLTSTDGGRSFTGPVKATGPLAFQVRLIADPTRAKRIYLAWLQAAGASAWGVSSAPNPMVVSRSDDGGTSWSNPVTINPPGRQRVVAPALAVSSRGDLLVSYLDVGDDRLDYEGDHQGKGGEAYPGPWSLLVARSRDHGGTWAESVLDAHLFPTQRFLMSFPPRPSIRAGAGGRVYVAFHDAKAGDADVLLWTSTKGAAGWQQAKRVNDTPVRDKRSQYLPALALAPNGRVDVVYYDRRSDSADIRNEVSFQSSSDAGSTFSRRLRLSDRPFDSRIGLGSTRGMPELGDRLALLATDSGDIAVWADTRAGAPITGKQVLAREVVAFARPSPAKPLLRDVGLALAATGAVFITWLLISGSRRRPHS